MMVRALTLIFMLGFMQAAVAGVPRDPGEFFFDQTLGDFSEELASAREQGKKGVFLFFEMDDCPFCHRMKEAVLNQPEVQAYFKEHFLAFTVDIEGDIVITDFQGNSIKEKDFAFKVHRVRATPVMMFLIWKDNQSRVIPARRPMLTSSSCWGDMLQMASTRKSPSPATSATNGRRRADCMNFRCASASILCPYSIRHYANRSLSNTAPRTGMAYTLFVSTGGTADRVAAV